MLTHFVIFSIDSYNGSGYDSSDDDDDDDDLEDEVRSSNLFPDKLKLKQDWKKARAGQSTYKMGFACPKLSS